MCAKVKTIRFQVVDAKSAQPRYLGQVELGPNDVMAVKLFATNRNGAEAVNVLFRDLTIRADRINGLGTSVRTVYDEVVYADPTWIEKGLLVVGGPPKPPLRRSSHPGPCPPTSSPRRRSRRGHCARLGPGRRVAAPAAAAAAAPAAAAPVAGSARDGRRRPGGRAVVVRAARAARAAARLAPEARRSSPAGPRAALPRRRRRTRPKPRSRSMKSTAFDLNGPPL